MLYDLSRNKKSKANFILKPETEVKMASQLTAFPASFKSSSS